MSGSAWSHPVLSTLARFVASPTISSQPITELAAQVARRCQDLGFAVELFEDDDDPAKVNVVCRAGPEEPGGLVLSGHMDVVPVAGQPWRSDPFVLTERGGAVFGRGTADMKGFIASTLHALERLDVSRLERPLVLIWTHDEEIGCVGSARLVPKLAAQGRPLPNEALIGEPTDFRILRMHPGHVAVTVTTHGEAAHSSKPDLGSSAIRAMHRVLGAVEALEQELKRERRLEAHLDRPYVTMNAGTLSGGTAVNLVPDRCELVLGYRPLPGDPHTAVFERLTERLAALDLPSGTRVEARLGHASPALHTELGCPLQHLLEPHSDGRPPASASFATDGGNLQALGMRWLIFGPGSIDVAHKADEHVAIADLLRAVDVIEDVVRQRCG